MALNELDNSEEGLISILRSFKFLYEYGYYENEISIAGRGLPTIVYHNNVLDRTIHVIGDEKVSWNIVIRRKRKPFFFIKRAEFAFDISDYYKYFDVSMTKSRDYTLKSQADFIKTYLLPVVKGEMWIDELLQKRIEL